MKTVHIIKYDNSANIGDNFQSYTTKQILERLGYHVDYIDRDADKIEGKGKKIFLINGYFCFKYNKNINLNFPKNVTPIFHNFHISTDNNRKEFIEKKFLGNKKIISTFKKYEPIGCRDKSTKDILSKFGIKAENNECITLLLDKRTSLEEKKAKKLLLVDVDEFIPIPKKFKKNFEYMSQMIPDGEKMTNDEKIKLSEQIIKYYRENAKLVITSRFHCAMPCIAMGVPVIFFGAINNRCETIKKYTKAYPYIHFGKRQTSHLIKMPYSDNIPLLRKEIKYGLNILDLGYSLITKIILNLKYQLGIVKIDWNCKPKDFEEEKKKRVHKIKNKLESKF